MQLTTLIGLIVLALCIVGLALYRIEDKFVFTTSLIILLIVLVIATDTGRFIVEKFTVQTVHEEENVTEEESVSHVKEEVPFSHEHDEVPYHQHEDNDIVPYHEHDTVPYHTHRSELENVFLDTAAFAELIRLPMMIKSALTPHLDNVVKATTGAGDGADGADDDEYDDVDISEVYYIEHPDATLMTSAGNVEVDKVAIIEKEYKAINAVLHVLKIEKPVAYEKLINMFGPVPIIAEVAEVADSE